MNYLKSSCMFQGFCVGEGEEYYFRVFKFALKGKFSWPYNFAHVVLLLEQDEVF